MNKSAFCFGRSGGLPLLAFLLTSLSAVAAPVSWISSISGNWGTSNNWSSGQPPGSADSVSITNANSKTVTINQATPTNSLAVNYLTLGALGLAVNTVNLNPIGTNRTLHVLNDLNLGQGGMVNVHTNGFLVVDGLTTLGAPLFSFISNNVNLVINSGTAQFQDLILGPTNGASGILIMTNGNLTVLGTLTLAAHPAGSTGIVSVLGGTLLHSNGVIVLGSYGEGQFDVRGQGATPAVQALGFQIGNGAGSHGALSVSNGVVSATSHILVGNDFGANPCSVTVYPGGSVYATNAAQSAYLSIAGNSSVTLSGGLLKTDHLINTNGGTCNTTNGTLIITAPAQVENGSTYAVSSGTASFGSDLTLGASAGSTGAVVVADGGVLNVSGTLGIGNDGSLTNGSGSGSATFANATVNLGALSLGSSAGGVGSLAIQSNAVVSVGSDITIISGSLTSTSTVSITGGSLVAANGATRIGSSGTGRLIISGGTHILRELDLGGTNGSGSFYGLGGRLQILQTLRPNWTVASGIDLDGSGGTIIIGDNHDAQLLVGAGTVTNFANMRVGYIPTPTFTGTYTQTGGVTHVTNSLVVGDCASGAHGVVHLSGGVTYVTNGLGTATLELQKGTFTMDDGSKLIVDTLNLSGSCGQFVYNGGTIHYTRLVLPSDAPSLVLTITLNSQPPAQPSSVTLSWPSIYVGYTLQWTSDPSQSDWASVDHPNPTDIGATRSVTLPLGTGNMFYRLAKP